MEINSPARIIELGNNIVSFMKLQGIQTISKQESVNKVKELILNSVRGYNNNPFINRIDDNISILDIDALKMVNTPSLICCGKTEIIVIACTMGGYLQAFCFIIDNNGEEHKQILSVEQAVEIEQQYLTLC